MDEDVLSIFVVPAWRRPLSFGVMSKWKGFSKIKIQAPRKPQEEGTSAQKSLEGAFLREGGRGVGEGASTKEAGSSGTGAQGSERPSPTGDKKHAPSLCKRCPQLFPLHCNVRRRWRHSCFLQACLPSCNFFLTCLGSCQTTPKMRTDRHSAQTKHVVSQETFLRALNRPCLEPPYFIFLCLLCTRYNDGNILYFITLL